MPWGKHQGERIADLPLSYLTWLASQEIEYGLREAVVKEFKYRELLWKYQSRKRERRRRRPMDVVREIYLQNLTCARIIRADPRRYQGIMQLWAGIVIAKGLVMPRDPHWTYQR
jgi:hypothetical protein